MNFHTNKSVMEKITEHYEDVVENLHLDISSPNFVGLFLIGSQNYGLDTINSDVDTRLIIAPNLENVIWNNAPASFVHTRDNGEKIHVQDVRLMFDIFKKQNPNAIEILFTKYSIVNPMYQEQWNKLVENREKIAYFNPYRAIHSIRGLAMETFKKLEKRTLNNSDIIDKFGYNGKRLCDLLRFEEYVDNYMNGTAYAECLAPSNADYLKEVKENDMYSLNEARNIANDIMTHINEMTDEVVKESHWNEENIEALEVMGLVQQEIVTKALAENFKEKNNV